MTRLFTGLTVPQQYVCLSLEDFADPLSVFLSAAGRNEALDVTSRHLFLGYSPLIMAVIFPAENRSLAAQDRVYLDFIHGEPAGASWKGLGNPDNCLASVSLRKVRSKKAVDQQIILYEGDYGEHRFINRFHQFVNNQRQKLRKENPNNVSLPGNLYDQVRIAYAVPRIISLITVSDGNKMNMFPTDLHGPAGSEFYMSSLRQGGKANNQVEQTGKLVLSLMPVEEYKTVYALGKNHMRDMEAPENFLLLPETSKILKLPVPASALCYKELNRVESFDVGIHRIHFYQIVHQEKIRDGHTLAHIHQYYAQWRIDHKQPLNIRLR